ncbi:MAG: hypothetical protein NUV75_11225 [Gallionella sp.]|nr:hypothetical protein [Gallionella sp.]
MAQAKPNPGVELDLSSFDWKNPDYESVFAERKQIIDNIRAFPEEKRLAVIAGMKELYKENPVQFIQDWGMTFDPRNAEVGLPTTIPFILFPRQENFINWLLERWQSREDGLTEKSRDMGVTWLCVAFAVWMWLFWEGTVIGFGSRKEEYVDKIDDPKCIFDKVRKFINNLPFEFKPAGWDERKHAPHMRIINAENDSIIVGEAGDNIGRGNRTSIYFKDESAFYEHPETIDSALSQTSNVKIDVSTPNGSGNPFYRKRHSGKIPVFVFDWREDPRKDQRWYQEQIQKHDAVIVAQEIDRDYESSVSNSYIGGDLVRGAMARGPTEVQAMGGLRVGVDVARYGNCKTVISYRQGRVLLKQEAMSKQSVTSVAGRVKEGVEAYLRAGQMLEQIAVDAIGVGGGVADILRGWYPDKYLPDGKTQRIVEDIVVSETMGNGQDYNLRAFMYRQMKEWLETGSIPRDSNLQTDLTALRYSFRGGELLIESKEDALKRQIKSPDYGDSLALTFAKPTVQKRPKPKVKPYRMRDRAMGS